MFRHYRAKLKPASRKVNIAEAKGANEWSVRSIKSVVFRVSLQSKNFFENACPALLLPWGASRMAQDGRRFGLIYIDGSQEFDDFFVDAYLCARLLEPGGIMLFDDRSQLIPKYLLRSFYIFWRQFFNLG